MEIRKKIWGMKEGKEVWLITFSNGKMELSFSNFGCAITAIRMADGSGKMKNLVLGYEQFDDYLHDPYYLGCIVGRVTGRISNASFKINGTEYGLARNDGADTHHLHGGEEGFSKKLFDLVSIKETENTATAEFHYRSPHMEEGYPGNVELTVTYTLSGENELTMAYRAVTDAPTHINLTNHCYFNLSGKNESPLADELFIDADRFVVCGDAFIPTGELAKVDNDPHDFRKRHPINRDWNKMPDGFNECYVVNGSGDDDKVKAILYHPPSGTWMSLKTTLPGILFYTGEYLDKPFKVNQGVCLETQFFPDTPNRPEFPTTLVNPGQQYDHHTTLKFSTENFN